MNLFGNRYSQGAGRVPTNPLTVGEKELNESRTRFPAPSTNPVVTAPQLPGGSIGNMGYDPLQEMLKNPEFKALYFSTPENQRSLVQQAFAQTRNVKDIDLNQLLSDQLANERTTLEIADLKRKAENAGKPAPETPEERMLGQILGRVPTFEEQQKALEKAANKRFQYDMMGRIPEAIMYGLGGSGQLMREGAKDISNTVMRGVEALPKPNIPVRSYQNPTFRYFQ